MSTNAQRAPQFAPGGVIGSYVSGDDSIPVVLSHGGLINDPDHAEALGLTVDARRLRQRDVLLRRLLDQHLTVTRPDPFATSEQYLVQCAACDSNHWHVWCPGDPVHECQFIREARELGVL